MLGFMHHVQNLSMSVELSCILLACGFNNKLVKMSRLSCY